MPNLIDKLGYIKTARNNIKTSLEVQGQDVGDDIRDYAESINTMCDEIELIAEDILGEELVVNE